MVDEHNPLTALAPCRRLLRTVGNEWDTRGFPGTDGWPSTWGIGD